MPRPRLLLGAALAAALVAAAPAFAYIDPGTGSMVLQLALAGLAAGLATLRLFWRRIVAFFRRGSR